MSRLARGQTTAERTLAQVDCADYAAVVFVGGGGSKRLFHDAEAWRIAREMSQQGKVVAAICLAPVILVVAGVLHGRQATVAGTEAMTLINHGAHYTGPGSPWMASSSRLTAPRVPQRSGAIVQLLAEQAAAAEAPA
ncbi:MAG: DJ-1/PfpI family protein [Anaerolineae bacterium]|nr:MAG: DJ-1/PfpI family protein [Anaerolineae bacterium]